MVWLTVVLIIIITICAMVLVASIRRRRLIRKIVLEITNQGNMDSRFHLRAEAAGGGLTFKFMQNSQPLSEIYIGGGAPVNPGGQAAASQPARSTNRGSDKVGIWISLAAALSSVLTGLGYLLPASMGKPLISLGSSIYQGQSQASRAQMVSQQAASLRENASSAVSGDTSQGQVDYNSTYTVAAPGVAWAETAPIPPGEKGLVDLIIQSVWISSDQARAFLLKSKSAEVENQALTVEDGLVNIRGGFWSRTVLPQLLILILAGILLFLVYWLYSRGMLF